MSGHEALSQSGCRYRESRARIEFRFAYRHGNSKLKLGFDNKCRAAVTLDLPHGTRGPMKRISLIIAFLVLASAGATWWLFARNPPRRQLVLSGDVDLRQVELAFNNSERIATVLVQEGD